MQWRQQSTFLLIMHVYPSTKYFPSALSTSTSTLPLSWNNYGLGVFYLFRWFQSFVISWDKLLSPFIKSFLSYFIPVCHSETSYRRPLQTSFSISIHYYFSKFRIPKKLGSEFYYWEKKMSTRELLKYLCNKRQIVLTQIESCDCELRQETDFISDFKPSSSQQRLCLRYFSLPFQ